MKKKTMSKNITMLVAAVAMVFVILMTGCRASAQPTPPLARVSAQLPPSPNDADRLKATDVAMRAIQQSLEERGGVPLSLRLHSPIPQGVSRGPDYPVLVLDRGDGHWEAITNHVYRATTGEWRAGASMVELQVTDSENGIAVSVVDVHVREVISYPWK